MFGIGLPELLVILVVALFVVGPKKLPGVARSLGQGVSELKRAAGEVMNDVSQHDEFKEIKKIKDDLQDTVKAVRDPMSALTESVKDEFAQTIDLDPEPEPEPVLEPVPDEPKSLAASESSDSGPAAGQSGLEDSVPEPDVAGADTPPPAETEKKSDA